MTDNEKAAYRKGQNAVQIRPLYSPKNPYDEESEPDLFAAWEDGAISAGICEIYTNGVLHKSERRK